MSVQMLITSADLRGFLPEMLLAAVGVVILLLDAFWPRARRAWVPLALLATAGAAWLASFDPLAVGTTFEGFLEHSPLTVFLSEVVLLATGICLAASQGYLARERLETGEYTALLLFCAVGLLTMLRSVELLTLFISLELLSLCLYALAAYHRRSALATEAGLKYFLMGAFVSSFVLLGIALVYGETGTTHLAGVQAEIAAGHGSPLLLTLAFLLLVCGFAFKMSVAPFHAWAPDAYQGAPSPFVAFLSVAPKAASALVLIRVLQLVMPEGRWPHVVAALAVVSMVSGNLLALVQKDIKRMLAYSGVGHMGYLLIPLVALGHDALPPVLVYLLAYALMNGGAFAVVALLFARSGEQHLISELSGWGYRFPLLGLCLTVSMLSLGGIPPTLGFLGKYLVFFHAIEHGNLWLALVGIATSLIGVFYYLRVVYYLYMKPELDEPRGLQVDFWGRLGVAAAALATLWIGILPGRLLDWLQLAIGRL